MAIRVHSKIPLAHALYRSKCTQLPPARPSSSIKFVSCVVVVFVPRGFFPSLYPRLAFSSSFMYAQFDDSINRVARTNNTKISSSSSSSSPRADDKVSSAAHRRREEICTQMCGTRAAERRKLRSESHGCVRRRAPRGVVSATSTCTRQSCVARERPRLCGKLRSSLAHREWSLVKRRRAVCS